MSELIVLFIFILINAFFAMSEIAIVQSSKPLLKQMVKMGNKRAALALVLVEDTGRSLSTIQVGITLVGILAGAYGGSTIAAMLTPVLQEMPFIAQHAHSVSLFLVVLLITYLSVVIGELVPKQYALAHPEKLAIMAAYPMILFSQIGKPIVWTLNTSASILLKIIGIDGSLKGNITEDEVKAVLSEGAESGAIEQNEYEMLRRIIALGDREVKTIMTPSIDVVSLDVNDDILTIRQKIDACGHSRLPVIDGSLDNLKGVVTAREVLEAALQDEVFDLNKMIREVPLLSDNVPCHKALELFKNFPVNLAVVIDEYGTVEGIVTASDVLEAIVGSVASNYEDNQPSIVQRADGTSWLVDGLTPVDEIVLTLGIDDMDKDDDSFTTVAGFVLSEMEKNPEVGDIVEAFDYLFEVVDMDGRRIDKIMISQKESQTDQSVSEQNIAEIA